MRGLKSNSREYVTNCVQIESLAFRLFINEENVTREGKFLFQGIQFNSSKWYFIRNFVVCKMNNFSDDDILNWAPQPTLQWPHGSPLYRLEAPPHPGNTRDHGDLVQQGRWETTLSLDIVREHPSMTPSRGASHWSGEIWHLMMPVLRQGWVVKQNMTWW